MERWWFSGAGRAVPPCGTRRANTQGGPTVVGSSGGWLLLPAGLGCVELTGPSVPVMYSNPASSPPAGSNHVPGHPSRPTGPGQDGAAPHPCRKPRPSGLHGHSPAREQRPHPPPPHSVPTHSLSQGFDWAVTGHRQRHP